MSATSPKKKPATKADLESIIRQQNERIIALEQKMLDGQVAYVQKVKAENAKLKRALLGDRPKPIVPYPGGKANKNDMNRLEHAFWTLAARIAHKKKFIDPMENRPDLDLEFQRLILRDQMKFKEVYEQLETTHPNIVKGYVQNYEQVKKIVDTYYGNRMEQREKANALREMAGFPPLEEDEVNLP